MNVQRGIKVVPSLPCCYVILSARGSLNRKKNCRKLRFCRKSNFTIGGTEIGFCGYSSANSQENTCGGALFLLSYRT